MTENILIVDEDPYARKYMEKLLAGMKYPYRICSGSFEALGTIKNMDFSLIITALRLKGVNGLKLCTMIKQYHPHTVIYAFSWHLRQYGTELLEKTGFDGFINKPSQKEVIIDAINGAFDRLKQNAPLNELPHPTKKSTTLT